MRKNHEKSARKLKGIFSVTLTNTIIQLRYDRCLLPVKVTEDFSKLGREIAITFIKLLQICRLRFNIIPIGARVPPRSSGLHSNWPKCGQKTVVRPTDQPTNRPWKSNRFTSVFPPNFVSQKSNRFTLVFTPRFLNLTKMIKVIHLSSYFHQILNFFRKK